LEKQLILEQGKERRKNGRTGEREREKRRERERKERERERRRRIRRKEEKGREGGGGGREEGGRGRGRIGGEEDDQYVKGVQELTFYGQSYNNLSSKSIK
jgi:hypothetical protein